MKKLPRNYTREYKEQAVALVTREHKSISETAKNLGIGYTVLHRWVHESKVANDSGKPVFTGKGHIALTAQDKRIKELERENYILRQEREILKSAAKFFAKEMR